MKKFLFIGATFVLSCLTIQNANAQLEVETSGNVSISKKMSIGTSVDNYTMLNVASTSTTSLPSYGIKLHLSNNSSMPTGPLYGIYSFADASASNGYPINPIVGICGKAYTNFGNTSTFSAGVVGLANYYNGIGVYGAIDSSTSLSLPTSSFGSYAGYFAGSVKVTATLTAATVTTTSDSRLKENIKPIEGNTLTTIDKLIPVTYRFIQDSVHYVYPKDAQEMNQEHYGLVAQDLQQILPDLVYESSDGYLSINYTELIPLLIKAVQELSAEVKELKDKENNESEQ